MVENGVAEPTVHLAIEGGEHGLGIHLKEDRLTFGTAHEIGRREIEPEGVTEGQKRCGHGGVGINRPDRDVCGATVVQLCRFDFKRQDLRSDPKDTRFRSAQTRLNKPRNSPTIFPPLIEGQGEFAACDRLLNEGVAIICQLSVRYLSLGDFQTHGLRQQQIAHLVVFLGMGFAVETPH